MHGKLSGRPFIWGLACDVENMFGTLPWSVNLSIHIEHFKLILPIVVRHIIPSSLLESTSVNGTQAAVDGTHTDLVWSETEYRLKPLTGSENSSGLPALTSNIQDPYGQERACEMGSWDLCQRGQIGQIDHVFGNHRETQDNACNNRHAPKVCHGG
jgi:hypothetical protein